MPIIFSSNDDDANEIAFEVQQAKTLMWDWKYITLERRSAAGDRAMFA